MVRYIWVRMESNARGSTTSPIYFFLPILAFALLAIIALGGAQAASELEIFAGQDKSTYERFPLAFNDALIIKPSPLDPERTYSFHWDFDSFVDSDEDGVRDNDNQSNERFARWTYHVRGKYLVTLTVEDGETYAKSTLFVTVNIEPGQIEYILTDKREYVTGEVIEVTTHVSRGLGPPFHPWLQPWEGTLVLETMDDRDEVVWEREHHVVFSSTESNTTFNHTYTIDAPGDYRVMGTLTWDNRSRASEHNTSFRVTDAPDDVVPEPEPVSEVLTGDGIMDDDPFVPVLMVSLLVVLASFAGAYGTEIGRSSLFGLMAPLYTRLRKEEVLDQFTRGNVYGYVVANPGDSYGSIKGALGLSNGSLAYHLNVLEVTGYVRSARDGTLRRVYPSTMRIPSNDGALKKTQQLILEIVRETPGISQKDIASLLGVSSPTVNYHMEGLLEQGIVRAERKGIRVRYFIVP
jgi:DNA-binding MarR family transcriptional regulator